MAKERLSAQYPNQALSPEEGVMGKQPWKILLRFPEENLGLTSRQFKAARDVVQRFVRAGIVSPETASEFLAVFDEQSERFTLENDTREKPRGLGGFLGKYPPFSHFFPAIQEYYHQAEAQKRYEEKVAEQHQEQAAKERTALQEEKLHAQREQMEHEQVLGSEATSTSATGWRLRLIPTNERNSQFAPQGFVTLPPEQFLTFDRTIRAVHRLGASPFTDNSHSTLIAFEPYEMLDGSTKILVSISSSYSSGNEERWILREDPSLLLLEYIESGLHMVLQVSVVKSEELKLCQVYLLTNRAYLLEQIEQHINGYHPT